MSNSTDSDKGQHVRGPGTVDDHPLGGQRCNARTSSLPTWQFARLGRRARAWSGASGFGWARCRQRARVLHL